MSDALNSQLQCSRDTIAALQARIRELEQERDTARDSLAHEEMERDIARAQLQEVTQERDGLLHDNAFPALKRIAQLEARNGALEEELREALKAVDGEDGPDPIAEGAPYDEWTR